MLSRRETTGVRNESFGVYRAIIHSQLADGTVRVIVPAVLGSIRTVDVIKGESYEVPAPGDTAFIFANDSFTQVYWANSFGSGKFSGALEAATGTFAGDISAATGTFANEINVGGSDDTSFHVDVDGNMWSGAAAFADAPFKVASNGNVTIGDELTMDAATGDLGFGGGTLSGGALSSSAITASSTAFSDGVFTAGSDEFTSAALQFNKYDVGNTLSVDGEGIYTILEYMGSDTVRINGTFSASSGGGATGFLFDKFFTNGMRLYLSNGNLDSPNLVIQQQTDSVYLRNLIVEDGDIAASSFTLRDNTGEDRTQWESQTKFFFDGPALPENVAYWHSLSFYHKTHGIDPLASHQVAWNDVGEIIIGATDSAGENELSGYLWVTDVASTIGIGGTRGIEGDISSYDNLVQVGTDQIGMFTNNSARQVIRKSQGDTLFYDNVVPKVYNQSGTYVGELRALETGLVTLDTNRSLTTSDAYLGTSYQIIAPKGRPYTLLVWLTADCSITGGPSTAVVEMWRSLDGGAWVSFSSSAAIFSGDTGDRGTVSQLYRLGVPANQTCELRIYGRRSGGTSASVLSVHTRYLWQALG